MKLGVETTRRGEAATAHPLDAADPLLEALRELLDAHRPAAPTDASGATRKAVLDLVYATRCALGALRRLEPVSPSQEKP